MDNLGKDNEPIIDAEFRETNSDLFNDENINGKPLYYTCKQVAQIVEENESTIRYWAKVFEPILKIEVSNMTKKYTKTNIENLLFIKKLLKEDNMTVKQTLEYCSKKGFNNDEGLIDTSKPLAIKVFTKAMTEEFNGKFDYIQGILLQQQQTINNLTQIIINNNIELSNSICRTIDEVVSDKLDEHFDSLEQKITKEMNDKTDRLRELMNERKEAERIKENNKGFFKKLFNK